MALSALQTRTLSAGFELPLQPALAGGEGESAGDADADDGVEPDCGPGADAIGEREQDERRGDEAEGELRDEPGEDVVVALCGEGFAAVGGEDEGAEEAAGVWEDVSMWSLSFSSEIIENTHSSRYSA
jgi:hypothetical protein